MAAREGLSVEWEEPPGGGARFRKDATMHSCGEVGRAVGHTETRVRAVVWRVFASLALLKDKE